MDTANRPIPMSSILFGKSLAQLRQMLKLHIVNLKPVNVNNKCVIYLTLFQVHYCVHAVALAYYIIGQI